MVAAFLTLLLALAPADTHTIESEAMGETRAFRVAVPASYATSSVAYPVLYVLDGRYNLDLTTDVLSHLSRWGTVPEMIVVAVHNTTREWDMTPPDLPMVLLDGEGGRADRFLDFFEDELVPFVEARYRAQPLRVLVGHSHGGLFTSYAMVARPRLFAWHLALDAPVHHEDGWMIARLTEAVARDPGLAKRYVSVQERYRWPEDAWTEFAAAASGRHAVDRVTDLGETHESLGFLGTAHGLKRLFRDHAKALELPAGPELDAHFASLSEPYGYDVELPLGLRLGSADELLMHGRANEAKALLLDARRDYGDSPLLSQLMIETDRRLASGIDLNSIVDELTALPPESAEAAAAYLGTWEGTSFHEGGVPVHMRVTLESSGEVVSARMRQRSPFGEGYGEPEPLAFLRVVDDGRRVEWGELNRRGPGIGVYRMALGEDGRRLVGTMDLVGIPDGLLPDDFEMPVINVDLERRE